MGHRFSAFYQKLRCNKLHSHHQYIIITVLSLTVSVMDNNVRKLISHKEEIMPGALWQSQKE